MLPARYCSANTRVVGSASPVMMSSTPSRSVDASRSSTTARWSGASPRSDSASTNRSCPLAVRTMSPVRSVVREIPPRSSSSKPTTSGLRLDNIDCISCSSIGPTFSMPVGRPLSSVEGAM